MLRVSPLRGYNFEGMTEKLIASLYADDTTVYLSEHDDYDTLMAILDVWCGASGAKFNTGKTEIIPLGKETYRQALIDTRRLNPDSVPILDGVWIARDGEATRILGAWPGNNVREANAWSVILDKTRAALKRWENMKPTLIGKSMLSHAFIGGFSQYLMAAQGMPIRIECKLEKMTLDFFWSGR
ncbi:hypothetical protein AURDEDRAFT_29686, partial [Auricularia subglabra TFB-10046 SS5]